MAEEVLEWRMALDRLHSIFFRTNKLHLPAKRQYRVHVQHFLRLQPKVCIADKLILVECPKKLTLSLDAFDGAYISSFAELRVQ